jgi:hypothetical protein
MESTCLATAESKSSCRIGEGLAIEIEGSLTFSGSSFEAFVFRSGSLTKWVLTAVVGCFGREDCWAGGRLLALQLAIGKFIVAITTC